MDMIETILINGFIVLMLFILWAWDLPKDSRLNRLARKLKGPIQSFGLEHYWQMFGPEPLRDNCRLQFEIRMADGSIVAVEPDYLRFPDPRRQRGHYRWTEIKIALIQEDSDSLRVSMCKFVAAEFQAHFSDEAKRPVQVRLVRLRQPALIFGTDKAETVEQFKRRTIFIQPITLDQPIAVSSQNVDAGRLSLCVE